MVSYECWILTGYGYAYRVRQKGVWYVWFNRTHRGYDMGMPLVRFGNNKEKRRRLLQQYLFTSKSSNNDDATRRSPLLAYTMAVTEQWDVYSFGVVVLETIMGSNNGNGMLKSQSEISTYNAAELAYTMVATEKCDGEKIAVVIGVNFVFHQVPFLHKQIVAIIVAVLEIICHGIWNFFRLENEHPNNVDKYRAFKSVPLPFNYDKDGDKDE
ncbi:hypothetical protein TEA_030078 [Camellia sinensis var. sinensis]|uniref:EXS domain-containing protein n=1 Tax=Camellia sinensis var. sinensis TaxID=542762 RepID=A0A4S4DMP6_CAMSN|nr:hypothetical protein TEA_030078 [Camellia sinensis var. sinensis]